MSVIYLCAQNASPHSDRRHREIHEDSLCYNVLKLLYIEYTVHAVSLSLRHQKNEEVIVRSLLAYYITAFYNINNDLILLFFSRYICHFMFNPQNSPKLSIF